MNDSPYCGAPTKSGGKCLAFKAFGRDTCASHDPPTLARRRPNINRDTIPRLEAERLRLSRQISRLRDRMAEIDARLRRYEDVP